MDAKKDTSSPGRIRRVTRRLSPPDMSSSDSIPLRDRVAALTPDAESSRLRRQLARIDLGDHISISEIRRSVPHVTTPANINSNIIGERLPDSKSTFSLDQTLLPERLSPTKINPAISRTDLIGRVSSLKGRNPLQDASLPTWPSRPTVSPRLGSSLVQDRLAESTVPRARPTLPDTNTLMYGERDGIPDRECPTTTPEFFVGVVPHPHSDVTSMLEECPLQRSYVTHPKVLSDEEFEVHQAAESIWVYRPWSLSHFQWHVPLFEMESEDAVYVFFHHEYNWLRHPAEHYDAEYLNPKWGRDRVLDLFDSAGITLKPCCSVDSETHELAAAYCTCGGGS